MRSGVAAIHAIAGRAEILAAVHAGNAHSLMCLGSPSLQPEWTTAVAPWTDLISVSPDGSTAVTARHLHPTAHVIDLVDRRTSRIDVGHPINRIETTGSDHACFVTSVGPIDIDLTTGTRNAVPAVDYPSGCVWLKHTVTSTVQDRRLSVFQEHVVFSQLSTGRVVEVRQLGERNTVGLAPFGVPHPIDPLKLARIVDKDDPDALAVHELPSFVAGDRLLCVDDTVLLFSGTTIAQVRFANGAVTYYRCAALPSLGDARDVAYHPERGVGFTVVDFEVRTFGPFTAGQPSLAPDTSDVIPARRLTPPCFVRPGSVACEPQSDSLIVINYDLQRNRHQLTTYLALLPLDGGTPRFFDPDDLNKPGVA